MPKHVLYLHASSQLGGSQISILTLMRHLDPARYVPHLQLAGMGPYWEMATSYGIDTYIQEFPWFSKRTPWVYLRNAYEFDRRLCRSYDLVCTNCLRSLVYAGRHFRLLRIPYVCHVRDCLQAWFEHRNLALLNHARRIITNSEAITAVCREEGVKAGLIRTVYNPIDIERLRNLSIDTKHQFHVTNDVPYDAFVFGLPGRIEEIKGQTDFIGAAAIVAKHVSNAHFLIIGDTGDHEYLALLKQRVQIHNLDRVVHFVEFQHDIAAIMSSVDVVVVPSQLRPAVTTPIPPGSVGKQVGFGRVVVEAMAAGRPVIAAGIDGISEVVEHERNGLIVPPGDIDALACAMSRLVQDSRLFVQLRKNGLDTARRFTPERHANQIQAIYDDILNL